MRKLILFLLLLLTWIVSIANKPTPKYIEALKSYYLSLDYKSGQDTINFIAFKYMILGKKQLKERLTNDSIVTIIDYSLPIDCRRLWVINLYQKKVLFNTFVSHGENSGKDIPVNFSNKINSHKSSLGFFITGTTYNSRNVGYALKMIGLEPGINNNVLTRGIVFHGSKYANKKGRSWGCPSLPEDEYKKIINVIKDSSMVFIYSTDTTYFQTSKILDFTK